LAGLASRWYPHGMNLPGRLRATTLGDVLGALFRDRTTGVLELVEAKGIGVGRRHRLHLDAGLVQEVETSLPVPKLGDILRQEGFIDAEAARKLSRSLLEHPTKRTGELLIRERLARREEVVAALRHQLRARLEAIYRLDEAWLRFHIARPRRVSADGPVALSPHEFLRGRPRWRDRCPRAGANPGFDPPPAGKTTAELADQSRRRAALSLLGLSEPVDRETVQKTFRRLAAKLHPDRHPGAKPGELASLMRGFAQLTAAYHELVA
jgi:hypothetical protein